MADWNALPDDITLEIAKELTAVEDLVALSAVSSSCRSTVAAAAAAAATRNGGGGGSFYQQPPWLMLSEKEEEEEEEEKKGNKRGFFSLCKKKKHLLNLPETSGRRCWGSPHGWIVTLGLDLQIHLLNPLTRQQIPLPSTTSFESQPDNPVRRPSPNWMRSIFIERAIILRKYHGSVNDPNQFLVLAVLGPYNFLAVARPHENAWPTVVCTSTSAPQVVFDVALFSGQVYALCSCGMLALLSNLDGPDTPKATYISSPAPQDVVQSTDKLYLLESSGELLMVVRYIYDIELKTEGFDVYKFDFAGRNWVEMEDLGNCALFVGDNVSMSVSLSKDHNCRSNCIYFTDDDHVQWGRKKGRKGGDDMGVYDFRTMTIEPHYVGDDSLSTYSAPLWVIPSFA